MGRGRVFPPQSKPGWAVSTGTVVIFGWRQAGKSFYQHEALEKMLRRGEGQGGTGEFGGVAKGCRSGQIWHIFPGTDDDKGQGWMDMEVRG